MSPVDKYPRLMFGRTKIAIAAQLSADFNAPVGRVRAEKAIVGIDTVVAPYPNDLVTDEFEFCEIIAVSPIMASAPPIAINDEQDDEENVEDDDESQAASVFGEGASDDDDDDPEHEGEPDDYFDDWGPTTEDRQSATIERHLDIRGLSEVPVFGRRLLLVNYDQDLSAFDMDKAKQRVRKRLGSPVAVWQGRSFEGYCFVDNTVPDRILSQMDNVLLSDDVDDFLLVQPVAMVTWDKSGLSPLGDWIQGGWKQPKLIVPDRRSGRSGRRG